MRQDAGDSPEIRVTESVEHPVLAVRNLTVRFPDSPRSSHGRDVVKNVSLEVRSGEILGVVGESGSGKSLTAFAVLDMVPAPGRRVAGEIVLDGEDISNLGASQMRQIRGRQISMVFQDPLSSFNPSISIGEQLIETILAHFPTRARDASDHVRETLQDLSLPSTAEFLARYPHHLSGGMLQRVMIAMAILNRPRLILADEPTTALDVTIQAQVLELLRKIRDQLNTGILLITHNLGLVAEACDRAVVMRGGQIVEAQETRHLLKRPETDYTKALLEAVPSFEDHGPMPSVSVSEDSGLPDEPPLVEGRGLVKSFRTSGAAAPWRLRHRAVRAVAGVDFAISKGETLGIVGESGCGKSTLGRLIAGLLPADQGDMLFEGRNVRAVPREGRRRLRAQMQIIFQNPYGSLDPRMRIADIVAEPLVVNGVQVWTGKVEEVITAVGLSREHLTRYPAQLSGGQRQRVAIARALILQPKLIVCDEVLSALDVVVQHQIVQLLRGLQDRLALSYAFISHDLGVVHQLAHRVAVMYLGEIVETGPTSKLFVQPLHPYTRALVSAVPSLRDTTRSRRRVVLAGDVPNAANPPPGCPFHTRCPIGPLYFPERKICVDVKPALVEKIDGRKVACHFAQAD